MNQPLSLPGVRPGPSGSQRAGSTSGFTNLAVDLDANFATFQSWAAKARGNVNTATYSTPMSWIANAANWALSAETIARRSGRLIFATIVTTSVGTVTSSATGDVTPDLLVATITEPTLRPVVPITLTASCYTGVNVTASLRVDPDGKVYVTGLSTPITATNLGFCITTAWSAALLP